MVPDALYIGITTATCGKHRAEPSVDDDGLSASLTDNPINAVQQTRCGALRMKASDDPSDVFNLN